MDRFLKMESGSVQSRLFRMPLVGGYQAFNANTAMRLKFEEEIDNLKVDFAQKMVLSKKQEDCNEAIERLARAPIASELEKMKLAMSSLEIFCQQLDEPSSAMEFNSKNIQKEKNECDNTLYYNNSPCQSSVVDVLQQTEIKADVRNKDNINYPAVDTSTRLFVPVPRSSTKEWMTTDLRYLLNIRSKAYKKAKLHPTAENTASYRLIKSNISREIQRRKRAQASVSTKSHGQIVDCPSKLL